MTYYKELFKNKPKIKKDFFTFEEVLHAYMQCRKHKRETKTAIDFEKNFIPKLQLITKQLNEGTYEFGRYKCFPVKYPKPREIWAASFKDRILHHLVYNEIHKEFEKHYIDQTYSCLKGRGVSKCIKDSFKGCRSITKNFQEEAFFIKLDIKSFYVSINKNILWNLIKEKVDENSLLGSLIKKIIFYDITKNPIIVKNNIMDEIPKNKSLFNIDYKKQGLPIGNLTSQFFSNVYLNGLDLYCKHYLKLKYYYRYADDILILVKNSHTANTIINNIDKWLQENRKLELNAKKTVINRIRLGIKFLGYSLFYYYIIPQARIFEKIKSLEKLFRRDIFNKNVFNSLNSYLGMCSNYNTFKVCSRILNKCSLKLIYNNDAKKIILL